MAFRSLSGYVRILELSYDVLSSFLMGGRDVQGALQLSACANRSKPGAHSSDTYQAQRYILRVSWAAQRHSKQIFLSPPFSSPKLLDDLIAMPILGSTLKDVKGEQ